MTYSGAIIMLYVLLCAYVFNSRKGYLRVGRRVQGCVGKISDNEADDMTDLFDIASTENIIIYSLCGVSLLCSPLHIGVHFVCACTRFRSYI